MTSGNIRSVAPRHLAAGGALLFALAVGAFRDTEAAPVVRWELRDYNHDGLQSDLSFGPSPVAAPPGNSVNSFGFTAETGCINATDGDTCDPIRFDSGAIGTRVFTSGFSLNGSATVFPETTGSMSADITGGILAFGALPFGMLQPGPSSAIQVLLPPGSFPVFGSPFNTTADFGFLTIEDLTSLGNGQFGVVVRWLHQGPSCLGCFDSLETRIRLEGVMTVVPAPASIWLFASGVAGLFGVNNRRRLLRKAG